MLWDEPKIFFLEQRYFFSIILSEFLKNRVALQPVSPFHTEDLISDVSSDALLSHFRNRYHGTARLGIEAMELQVRGYSCADIAKLYQKKPNYIGACISRATEKLRRERIVREFYTACTEQDIKSA